MIGRSRCLKLKASSARLTSDSFCLALADNSLHTINIKSPAIDEMKLTEIVKKAQNHQQEYSNDQNHTKNNIRKKEKRKREILTIERLKRYNDWK